MRRILAVFNEFNRENEPKSTFPQQPLIKHEYNSLVLLIRHFKLSQALARLHILYVFAARQRADFGT